MAAREVRRNPHEKQSKWTKKNAQCVEVAFLWIRSSRSARGFPARLVAVRARLYDFRLGNEVRIRYGFLRLARLAHVGEIVLSDC